MPDSGAMSALRSSAIARIGKYIEVLPGAGELGTGVVGQYGYGKFLYGWEVEHRFSDTSRNFTS